MSIDRRTAILGTLAAAGLASERGPTPRRSYRPRHGRRNGPADRYDRFLTRGAPACRRSLVERSRTKRSGITDRAVLGITRRGGRVRPASEWRVDPDQPAALFWVSWQELLSSPPGSRARILLRSLTAFKMTVGRRPGRLPSERKAMRL